MKTIPLFVTLSLLVLNACGPSGGPGSSGEKTPVAAADTQVLEAVDLWPLEVGNQWTFEVEEVLEAPNVPADRRRFERVLKVTKAAPNEGGKTAELAVLDQDGKTLGVIHIEVNKGGIYQLGMGSGNSKVMYEKPFPLMLWPAKKGEKSSWKGKGARPGIGTTGDISANFEQKGRAIVDSAAGRFSAYRFDTLQQYEVNKVKFETAQAAWFAPGVGMVRSLETVATSNGARQSQKLVLKSHTVK